MTQQVRMPSSSYDRKAGAYKPRDMLEVAVGGWAEVCVGEWRADEEQIVFGYIAAIEGQTIYLRVADEICSHTKTGLTDGDLIAVTLEDLFGSELSPFACFVEKRLKVDQDNRARAKKLLPPSGAQWEAR